MTQHPSDKVEAADLADARKWVEWVEGRAAERYDACIRQVGRASSDVSREDVQRNYNSLAAVRRVKQLIVDVAGQPGQPVDYDPDKEFMRIVQQEGWLPPGVGEGR